jgi:SLT domain-containing protein
MQPVMELVARESSFNPDASNPNSSARGLFQMINSTRNSYGGKNVDWSDPYQQSLAGLQYIKQRYGDPVSALKHWDKYKSY